MQNLSQEQIMKRFQALPEALKSAIFADKTSDVVSKSCALRDVPGNKSPIVGQMTTRVLLGYLRPEQFAQEIQKETGVEELKAQHVAHDIDTEIFSEVRLELKKLYPPTLQTPNVQTQGFARGTSPAPAAPAPKPKYVIPIPEKFQGKSFPGIAPQQAPSVPTIPTASAPIPIQPVVPAPAPQPPATVPEPKSTPVQQAPQPMPVAAPKPEPKPAVPLASPAPSAPVQIATEKKSPAPPMPSPTPVPASAQPAPEKKQEQISSAPTPSKMEEKKTESNTKVAQTVEPGGVKMNPVVPLPTFIGSRFTAQAAENTEKPSEEKIKEMASKFTTPSIAQQKSQPKNPYQEKVDSSKKQGTVDLSKF